MAGRTLKTSALVGAKLKALAALARGSVSIGFMGGATYPDGTSVASVAFWNEFGHGGKFPAPPRPFFRTMISENQGKWPGMMAKSLKVTKLNGQKTLAYMGEEIDGELKQSIIDLSSPALSLVTLRLRKKFGNHPEDIRARDVIAAQKELSRVMIQTKKGTPRKMPALAEGTGANPLIWTGHLLNSTAYRVKSGPVMEKNVDTGAYQERA